MYEVACVTLVQVTATCLFVFEASAKLVGPVVRMGVRVVTVIEDDLAAEPTLLIAVTATWYAVEWLRPVIV